MRQKVFGIPSSRLRFLGFQLVSIFGDLMKGGYTINHITTSKEETWVAFVIESTYIKN